MDASTTIQKLSAEALGTFVLVFIGVGAVLMSGGDYVATGLAFGIAVMVMYAAVARVSGGHFNPAVSLGAALGGRMAWRDVPAYWVAQVVGGFMAGLCLYLLMQGFPGFVAEGNMGQNSFGDEGTGYAWWAAFALEALLTAVLLWVFLGVTDARSVHTALAPMAIGLAYTMIHFASIGATGTSVNPARSIGVGLFAGGDAIIQLWLFILAPLVGAAVAGLTYALMFGRDEAEVPGAGLHLHLHRTRHVRAHPAA